MKLVFKIICIVSVLLISIPAMAKLRGYPLIESIGLVDESPLRIAVVFNNGRAFSSEDGGGKWTEIKKESLPAKLAPLPLEGEIRYQLAGTVVRLSRDSGRTWDCVSPSFIFVEELRRQIEDARIVFNNKFFAWRPDFKYWPVLFSIVAFAFVAVCSVVLSRRHESWLMSATLSLVLYFLLGIAFWSVAYFHIEMCTWLQWSNLETGSWGPMICPRWSLWILLLLCGNPKFAALTVALCFPLTPIFNSMMIMGGARFKILRLAWSIAALLFVVAIPFALFFGRGDYWEFP